MKCSECGSEVREGVKFCRECGHEIVWPTEALLENLCPVCGEQLAPDSLVCNNCQAQVSETISNLEPEEPRCPLCGNKVKINASFCGKCGATLREIPPKKETSENKVQNPKKEKGFLGWIIVLIAVIIGCGGTIGYVVHRNNSVDIATLPIERNVESETAAVLEQEAIKPPQATVSTYQAVKTDMSWYSADNEAKQLGGSLVSINDEEEFLKVCGLADANDLKVFWVGAKRNKNDSWQETKWIDGKDIVFTKWYPGEPSYLSEEGNEEEFLMIFKVNGTWYFNDAENDVEQYYTGKMGYIAEIEEEYAG